MTTSLPPSDEARLRHTSTIAAGQPSSAWTGWVAFAAMLLVLLGCINLFQGTVALFDEGYFVAAADDLFLISYDAWGVLLLAWGCLQVLVGLALMAGRGWARWLAIGAVLVNTLAQVGFFPSFPLLATMMIGLNVVVLFALTAHWGEAQRGL